MARFRFRPRFAWIPWVVAAVGIAMLAFGLYGGAAGASRAFAIATGLIGPLIAVAYLRSPAWKLVVVVDEEAFEVTGNDKIRFRLPWTDVKEVVYSNTYPTAFV